MVGMSTSFLIAGLDWTLFYPARNSAHLGACVLSSDATSDGVVMIQRACCHKIAVVYTVG